LEKLETPGGTNVKAGQPLARLHNGELVHQIAAARAQLEELEALWRAGLHQGSRTRVALEEGIAAVRARVQDLEERQTKLVVTAPISGLWVGPREDELLGRWLTRGTALGSIVGSAGFEFLAVVPQADSSRLFAHETTASHATVRLHGQADAALPVSGLVGHSGRAKPPALGRSRPKRGRRDSRWPGNAGREPIGGGVLFRSAGRNRAAAGSPALSRPHRPHQLSAAGGNPSGCNGCGPCARYFRNVRSIEAAMVNVLPSDDYRRLAVPKPAKLPRGADALAHRALGWWHRRPRQLEALRRDAAAVDAKSGEFEMLDDAALRGRLAELSVPYRLGRDALRPETAIDALAAVREAAHRQTGLRPFVVQLMGALALDRGFLAEMGDRRGQDAHRPRSRPFSRAGAAGLVISSPSTTIWPSATRNGLRNCTPSRANGRPRHLLDGGSGAA